MAKSNWAVQKEVGAGDWQLRFMQYVFTILGSLPVRLLAFPLTTFFFLIAGRRRSYYRDFTRTVSNFENSTALRLPSAHRNFQAFAASLVDKMSAWAGRLNLKNLEYGIGDDYHNLFNTLKDGQGVLALCSHLGNVEMLRALGSMQVEGINDFRIMAIVEFSGTGKFNKMLERINDGSMAGIIPVSDIGPETIIRLQEFAAGGGMIVIAGDRISPNAESKTIRQNFLGKSAAFPYGSFLLADLLKVPIYTIFAMRTNDISLKSRYRFHVQRSGISLEGPRNERRERIGRLAGEFRDRLQDIALKYPGQWFNYYAYWDTGNENSKG